jgi:hypothetical protein
MDASVEAFLGIVVDSTESVAVQALEATSYDLGSAVNWCVPLSFA